MTTAQELPHRIQTTIANYTALCAVHALLPLKSQRQISTELKLSRRKVAEHAARPRPLDLDMSATSDAIDIYHPMTSEPTMKRSDALTAICALAVRPVGVRYHEYEHILLACFGTAGGRLNMSEEEHRQIRADVKRKARAGGREAVFVPAWIDANDPRASHQAMLNASQRIFEAIEHAALEFAERFPGVPYQSAMHELRCIAVPGVSAEPLGQRLERTAAIVDYLEGHPINIAGQLARPSTARVPEGAPLQVAQDDLELARLCL